MRVYAHVYIHMNEIGPDSSPQACIMRVYAHIYPPQACIMRVCAHIYPQVCVSV